MTKNNWTEQELLALDEVSSDTGMAAYHHWGALTNYSRSFNSFEVKRRRVEQGGVAWKKAVEIQTPSIRKAQAAVGIPEEFVGFTVGFFDIESTFSNQPIVLYAAIADQFGRVEEFRKGPNIVDDRELVRTYCARLEEFDILVGWNSTLFDIPVLRGRALFHGLKILEPHMTIDLMYKASGSAARIGRRSLASVSEYLDVPDRKTPLSVRTWDAAMAGDAEAYEKIATHCNYDVLVTRQVFGRLKRGIRNIHRLS
jgi:uncharacterized protein YprB with RNaseH-like and TPR domain